MSSIQSQFKKAAQGLGQKAVRQMFEEPLEIARTAGRQVSGIEKNAPRENEFLAGLSPKPQEGKPMSLEEDTKKAQSMLPAYTRELADIEKQNHFKNILGRIESGEKVVIENLDEFSIEEKQVLKAQEEAVQKQIEAQASQSSSLVEPTTRRPQGVQRGMPGKISQMKKHAEVRMPPSG